MSSLTKLSSRPKVPSKASSEKFSLSVGAVKQIPNSIEAHHISCGQMYLEYGKYKAAIEEFSGVLGDICSTDPSTLPEFKINCLKQRAQSYFQLFEYSKVVSDCTIILANTPNTVNIKELLNKATALLETSTQQPENSELSRPISALNDGVNMVACTRCKEKILISNAFCTMCGLANKQFKKEIFSLTSLTDNTSDKVSKKAPLSKGEKENKHMRSVVSDYSSTTLPKTTGSVNKNSKKRSSSSKNGSISIMSGDSTANKRVHKSTDNNNDDNIKTLDGFKNSYNHNNSTHTMSTASMTQQDSDSLLPYNMSTDMTQEMPAEMSRSITSDTASHTTFDTASRFNNHISQSFAESVSDTIAVTKLNTVDTTTQSQLNLSPRFVQQLSTKLSQPSLSENEFHAQQDKLLRINLMEMQNAMDIEQAYLSLQNNNNRTDNSINMDKYGDKISGSNSTINISLPIINNSTSSMSQELQRSHKKQAQHFDKAMKRHKHLRQTLLSQSVEDSGVSNKNNHSHNFPKVTTKKPIQPLIDNYLDNVESIQSHYSTYLSRLKEYEGKRSVVLEKLQPLSQIAEFIQSRSMNDMRMEYGDTEFADIIRPESKPSGAKKKRFDANGVELPEEVVILTPEQMEQKLMASNDTLMLFINSLTDKELLEPQAVTTGSAYLWGPLFDTTAHNTIDTATHFSDKIAQDKLQYTFNGDYVVSVEDTVDPESGTVIRSTIKTPSKVGHINERMDIVVEPDPPGENILFWGDAYTAKLPPAAEEEEQEELNNFNEDELVAKLMNYYVEGIAPPEDTESESSSSSSEEETPREYVSLEAALTEQFQQKQTDINNLTSEIMVLQQQLPLIGDNNTPLEMIESLENQQQISRKSYNKLDETLVDDLSAELCNLEKIRAIIAENRQQKMIKFEKQLEKQLRREKRAALNRKLKHKKSRNNSTDDLLSSTAAPKPVVHVDKNNSGDEEICDKNTLKLAPKLTVHSDQALLLKIDNAHKVQFNIIESEDNTNTLVLDQLAIQNVHNNRDISEMQRRVDMLQVEQLIDGDRIITQPQPIFTANPTAATGTTDIDNNSIINTADNTIEDYLESTEEYLTQRVQEYKTTQMPQLKIASVTDDEIVINTIEKSLANDRINQEQYDFHRTIVNKQVEYNNNIHQRDIYELKRRIVAIRAEKELEMEIYSSIYHKELVPALITPVYIPYHNTTSNTNDNSNSATVTNSNNNDINNTNSIDNSNNNNSNNSNSNSNVSPSAGKKKTHKHKKPKVVDILYHSDDSDDSDGESANNANSNNSKINSKTNSNNNSNNNTKNNSYAHSLTYSAFHSAEQSSSDLLGTDNLDPNDHDTSNNVSPRDNNTSHIEANATLSLAESDLNGEIFFPDDISVSSEDSVQPEERHFAPDVMYLDQTVDIDEIERLEGSQFIDRALHEESDITILSNMQQNVNNYEQYRLEIGQRRTAAGEYFDIGSIEEVVTVQDIILDGDGNELRSPTHKELTSALVTMNIIQNAENIERIDKQLFNTIITQENDDTTVINNTFTLYKNIHSKRDATEKNKIRIKDIEEGRIDPDAVSLEDTDHVEDDQTENGTENEPENNKIPLSMIRDAGEIELREANESLQRSEVENNDENSILAINQNIQQLNNTRLAAEQTRLNILQKHDTGVILPEVITAPEIIDLTAGERMYSQLEIDNQANHLKLKSLNMNDDNELIDNIEYLHNKQRVLYEAKDAFHTRLQQSELQAQQEIILQNEIKRRTNALDLEEHVIMNSSTTLDEITSYNHNKQLISLHMGKDLAALTFIEKTAVFKRSQAELKDGATLEDTQDNLEELRHQRDDLHLNRLAQLDVVEKDLDLETAAIEKAIRSQERHANHIHKHHHKHSTLEKEELKVKYNHVPLPEGIIISKNKEYSLETAVKNILVSEDLTFVGKVEHVETVQRTADHNADYYALQNTQQIVDTAQQSREELAQKRQVQMEELYDDAGIQLEDDIVPPVDETPAVEEVKTIAPVEKLKSKRQLRREAALLREPPTIITVPSEDTTEVEVEEARPKQIFVDPIELEIYKQQRASQLDMVTNLMAIKRLYLESYNKLKAALSDMDISFTLNPKNIDDIKTLIAVTQNKLITAYDALEDGSKINTLVNTEYELFMLYLNNKRTNATLELSTALVEAAAAEQVHREKYGVAAREFQSKEDENQFKFESATGKHITSSKAMDTIKAQAEADMTRRGKVIKKLQAREAKIVLEIKQEEFVLQEIIKQWHPKHSTLLHKTSLSYKRLEGWLKNNIAGQQR